MKKLILILVCALLTMSVFSQTKKATNVTNSSIVVTTEDSITSISPSLDPYSLLTGVEVANQPQYHLMIESYIESDASDSAYWHWDMWTFQHFSFTWQISGGVTMYVYGSNNPNATFTDWTSGYWIDITNEFFGAASVADEDDYYMADNPFVFRFILIRLIYSDSTNDVELWVYKWY